MFLQTTFHSLFYYSYSIFSTNSTLFDLPTGKSFILNIKVKSTLYFVHVVFSKTTENILKKKIHKLFIYTVFTPHDFIKQDYIPVDVFCD